MIQVPLNDLSRISVSELKEIQEALTQISISGNYILGPHVTEFEVKLADYLGAKYASSCGNGTDALELGLRAIGVKNLDLVATVPNAGGYATTAIVQIGAKPVFIDCDLQGRMDPESLLRALGGSEKISAVVITHLYGLDSNVEKILEICNERQIPVLEDCAQSIGAKISDKLLGTFGAVSTFSFYPTKNLGAMGDGGAVVTSNKQIAGIVRALRQYGWSSRYVNEIPLGKNSRLDELQAAVLNAKLRGLDEANEKRRHIWRRFELALPGEEWRLVGENSAGFVAHLGTLLTPNGKRDAAREFLAKNGISTGIHYPTVDYQQPAWNHYDRSPCSTAENFVSRILTIPLFPTMTDDEIHRVARALSGLNEVLQ